MTLEQMEAAAAARRDSLATATHNTVNVAYTQERMLAELRAECQGTARLTATEWGSYLNAPYNKQAVELLRAIGGQWNKEEKAWVVQSSRHGLMLTIANFIYSDVEEYEEYDGFTTAIYPDTM